MLLCGRTLNLREEKRKGLRATAMEKKHLKASCYRNKSQRFTDVVLKLLALAKKEVSLKYNIYTLYTDRMRFAWAQPSLGIENDKKKKKVACLEGKAEDEKDF